jgi:hypothetical protein
MCRNARALFLGLFILLGIVVVAVLSRVPCNETIDVVNALPHPDQAGAPNEPDNKISDATEPRVVFVMVHY